VYVADWDNQVIRQLTPPPQESDRREPRRLHLETHQ